MQRLLPQLSIRRRLRGLAPACAILLLIAPVLPACSPMRDGVSLGPGVRATTGMVPPATTSAAGETVWQYRQAGASCPFTASRQAARGGLHAWAPIQHHLALDEPHPR
jgi:hypothetical protein